jgi:flavodoxin/Fe-S-cluster-containing hydrogenase component 2
MGLIDTLIGRRQFMIASVTSAAIMGLGKVTRIFGPLSAGANEKKADAKKGLKAIVVYYSATGSTGKVAGAIYRGMKSVMDCDVAPIKKIDPKKMARYDVVAIGGPIWYFRETANLRLFVTKMPDMTGKLCVPFCTHGTNPDGFFFSLNQALQKKAFTVIGWDDWYGGCSHVLHQPSPYFTDGHPDEIDLQEAEAFGREMAERAQKIYAGQRDLIPEIPTGADAESLWVPQGLGEGGGMGNAMPGGSGGGMPGGGSGGGMPGGGGQGGQMTGGTAGVAGGAALTGGSPAGMPGGNSGGMPGGMPGAGGQGTQAQGAGAGGPSGTAGGNAGGGSGGGRGMPGNANSATMIPAIDLKKCIYPRCRSCMDMCLVDAINLSMITAPGFAEGSSLVVKEACKHCTHPLCEKACSYDAITFDNGTKTEHVFDMKKCTFPECKLCLEECPMESIELTKDSYHVKRNCEGCDVCWCVCPKDAISIPNIATTHVLLTPTSAEDGFFAALNAAEKAGKFRRLVPLDKIGWNNIVYKNPNAPRVRLKAENYPYEINELEKEWKTNGKI